MATKKLQEAILDKRLSYKARGIIAVSFAEFESGCNRTTSKKLEQDGKEGREAIRTAIRELKSLDYIKMERKRGSDGRFDTFWKFNITK